MAEAWTADDCLYPDDGVVVLPELALLEDALQNARFPRSSFPKAVCGRLRGGIRQGGRRPSGDLRSGAGGSLHEESSADRLAQPRNLQARNALAFFHSLLPLPAGSRDDVRHPATRKHSQVALAFKANGGHECRRNENLMPGAYPQAEDWECEESRVWNRTVP